jgi:hypothetical protein
MCRIREEIGRKDMKAWELEQRIAENEERIRELEAEMTGE